MSSYWFVLIKLFYIYPILRKTISWINTIKSAFVLIIFFYFQIRQRFYFSHDIYYFFFENIFISQPRNFLWIIVSAAKAAAVIPNGIKMLLVCSLIIFLINSKRTFTKGPRSLLKPAWLYYCIYFRDNLTLFRMGLFEAADGRGDDGVAKRLLSLKSTSYILK